jgi:hypothetical protein
MKLEKGTGEAGCTLDRYAELTAVPIDFLRQVGCSQISVDGAPAVRISYRDGEGIERGARLCIGVHESDLPIYRWPKNVRPTLYGEDNLQRAKQLGYIAVFDNEADAIVSRYRDIPAVAVLGVSSWQESWAEGLEPIPVVYVVITRSIIASVYDWATQSVIRTQIILVRIPSDLTAAQLNRRYPERYLQMWQRAVERARPIDQIEKHVNEHRAKESLSRCENLAQDPNILARFLTSFQGRGVVGQEREALLLFLVLTSRVLPRPASAVLKGPSSAGKSNLVDNVLAFFPPSAFYALTAQSEKAIVYGTESLVHRILVVYEAHGIGKEIGSYFIRSLLSENRISYEVTEKDPKTGQYQTRRIERPGPTGLITTTTEVSLHPENETRLLSLTLDDSAEQTRRVMQSIARRQNQSDEDLSEWHALQEWLDLNEGEISVPYAATLADAIPPLAVRLRRDFPMLLTLIRSHALLHQATRQRDEKGQIIATLEDYGAVRVLLEDILAEGLGSTVAPIVRDTVEAVKRLKSTNHIGGVTNKEIAAELGLDESAVSRRVKQAIEGGYLSNAAPKGFPAQIVLAEPMPGKNVVVLPTVNEIRERLHGCTNSQEMTPPPLVTSGGNSGESMGEGVGTCVPENHAIVQLVDSKDLGSSNE